MNKVDHISENKAHRISNRFLMVLSLIFWFLVIWFSFK